MLASDNMYLYENLDTHAPIAQTLDAASNLRAQDRMKSLAGEPRLLVPGHDPAVFDALSPQSPTASFGSSKRLRAWCAAVRAGRAFAP